MGAMALPGKSIAPMGRSYKSGDQRLPQISSSRWSRPQLKR